MVESIPTFVAPSSASSTTAWPTACRPRRVATVARTSTSTWPRAPVRLGQPPRRGRMIAVFAERGGDPDRVGKRDPLDPLLWRAHRAGEPAWDGGSLGSGRPGLAHRVHLASRCDHLGIPVRHPGRRHRPGLPAPRDERRRTPARCTACALRARLRAPGHGRAGRREDEQVQGQPRQRLDPAARGRRPDGDPAGPAAHHHATDWMWHDDDLVSAEQRLATWRKALSGNGGPVADQTVDDVRAALADDLDSPRALEAVDRWAHQSLTRGGEDPGPRACSTEPSTRCSACASEPSGIPRRAVPTHEGRGARTVEHGRPTRGRLRGSDRSLVVRRAVRRAGRRPG